MSTDSDAAQREGMRINKYIAHTGYCSRRDADDLIPNLSLVAVGLLAVALAGLRKHA